MMRVTVGVFEAIRERRSIRRFGPDPVDEEDLYRILDAGRWAPSAGNLQPWEFVVVRDPKIKLDLAEAALGQYFIAKAPVAIVICANVPRSSMVYGRRGAELYCIQDTALAAQNIMLAAYALGYGTCCVGAFDEDEVARIIKTPKGVKPVMIIALGRAVEKPRPTPRMPLDKFVHFDHF